MLVSGILMLQIELDPSGKYTNARDQYQPAKRIYVNRILIYR